MNTWHEWLEKIVHIMDGTGYLAMGLKTATVLAAAFIIYIIFRTVILWMEKKRDRDGLPEAGTSVLEIIKRVFFLAVVLITGSYLIRMYNLQAVERVFYSVMILLVAIPVKDFFHIAIKYLKQNLVNKTETKVDDIVFDLLHRFIGVITMATAIILALDVMGMNVMPFIAGAGVAGIAIGFAAKDTLSNLIAGVLLILDRPFEINDRIEVWSAPAGSASWGDVVDIGIRATKIRTTDNIIIIIPNNEIMKRDIVNYTLLSSRIRVRIDIGVAYDADIEKAKKAIIDVASSLSWVIQDPKPKVVVRNFGDSSIDLQLRVWINNARKRMDTISYITDHVKTAFDKEGVEIPYPRRDIVITHSRGKEGGQGREG